MATTLDILVKATDQATSVINGVGKAADNLGTQVQTVTSTTSKASVAIKGWASKLGLVAGGATAIKVLKDSIGQAEEAQRVAAQTEAVLKSTGGAANVTAGDVADLANKLSDLAAVDDEVIQQGENVLLTFTNVRNEVGKGNDIFDQATTAALDLSAAMGTDLQGAIVLIGKALQDPVKGMTALRRVGVSLDQQQQDMVKTLVDAGDALGAQKIILGELKKEFGGAAAANVTASKRMGVAFGNIEESLGGLLLPLLDATATVLEALGPLFEIAARNAGTIVTALAGFAALKYLPGLLLGIATRLAAVGDASLAAGIKASSAALTEMATGIGIVIAAAGAFTIVLDELATDLSSKIEEAAKAGGNALDDLNKKINDSQHLLDSLDATGIFTALVPGFEAMKNSLHGANDQIDAAIEKHDKAAAATRTHSLAARELDKSLLMELSGAAGAANAASDLAAAHKAAADAARGQWAAELALAGGFLGVEGAMLSAKSASDDLKDSRADLNKLERDGKKGTLEYRDALLAHNQAVNQATLAQLGLVQSVQDYIAENGKSPASTKQAIAMVREYGRQNGLTAGEIQGVINKVMTAIGVYGKTPKSVRTEFSAPGLDDSLSRVERLKQYIDGLHDKEVNVYVYTHLKQDA